ncbi:MAG: hypothetical protein VCD00_01790 [Candidatus Hydrogenedentota bacterium]
MKAVQISLLVIIALALWMIAFNTLVDTDSEPVVQHLEDGKTYQKKGDVTEVAGGNFVYREHKGEPVHFDEAFEYDEDGLLVSWGTSTPYNDNIFGRYGLSLRDMDTNGDMDRLSLSVNSQDDGWPMIMTIYEDVDGDRYPDTFIYSVMARGEKPITSRDLNLDGTFDFRTANAKEYIWLESGWQHADVTATNFKGSEPKVVLIESDVTHTFRDGEWVESQ